MYQKLIIAGVVSGEIAMKYTPDGKAVTNFTVAVSSKKGGEYKTTWFRCSIWGALAETASQYLKRKDRVLVEGRLIADEETGNPRVWTSKDGQHGASFEVLVDTYRTLSKADQEEVAG